MLSVVLLSLLLVVSSKPYYSRYNDATCSGDVVQQSTVESGECFPIGDGKSTRYVISEDHVKVSFFDFPNCKGLNGTVTAVSGVCTRLNGTLTGSMRIVTAAKLQGLFPSAPTTTKAAVKSGNGASPGAPNVFPGKKKANKKTANNKNGHGPKTTTCAPTAPKGRATKPGVVPMPSLFPKAKSTAAPSPGSCPKCAKKGKNAKKAAKKKKTTKKSAKKSAKKKSGKKNAGSPPTGLFPKP